MGIKYKQKSILIFCCLIILFTACTIKSDNKNGVHSIEENFGVTSLSTEEPQLSEGDYTYKLLDNGTVEITGYTGESQTLDIPSVLNGYTVTRLGDDSFRTPNDTYSNLVSVTIPESVLEIGVFAFYNNLNLTNVKILNQDTLIEHLAFSKTPFLNNRTEEFVIINHHLIKYNGEETDITIPGEVLYINEAFFGNSNIKSVIIPENVRKINKNAFAVCENLVKVTLPENCIIGINAFAVCYNLSEIILPESIKDIGSGALSTTKFIQNLESRNGGYAVVNNILLHTSYLIVRDVTIPEYLKINKIGNGAFSGHDRINNVILPNTVTEIGENAFFNCIYLKTITIPDSVTEIGKDAFLKCINLKILCTENSYAHKYSIENNINFELIS